MCFSVGGALSFGNAYTQTGVVTVVRFGFDSKVYALINTVCGNKLDSCTYIPTKDILITKQRRDFYNQSLVIYKNFTKRLYKTVDDPILGPSYSFDLGDPDFIFQSETGHQWGVGAIGSSQNGKWLAVEFKGRGIGILDLDNLQIKRVAITALSYGLGADPASEITVNNQGTAVVLMGVNAGLAVISVNSRCGDEPTENNLTFMTPIPDPCVLAQVNSAAFAERPYQEVHPVFSSDGGDLSFFTIAYQAPIYTVYATTIRANNFNPPRINYLALGDSFTSGEGETNDNYYIAGTNSSYDKCHLSQRSYPYLIARAMDIPNNSVACSGARASDVTGSENYWGQTGRLGASGLNLSQSERVIAQQAAVDVFSPGRAAQIEFVKQYHPKAITVGIGGNDIGFLDKLKTCVGPGTCEWADVASRKEQTALEIRSLYDILVTTYTQIHDASPESKIFAIGYPQIIATSGQCDLVTGVLLDVDEREFMHQGVGYVDQIIASAASAAGVKYVDIQSSLGNHILCSSEGATAMNGLRLGDDIAPIPLLGGLRLIGYESFHPTPVGHAMIAEAIKQTDPDLINEMYCSNEATVCPTDVGVPTPPAYWLAGGVTHDYPALHNVEFSHQQLGSTDVHQQIFNLDNYSFEPNSIVHAEINSIPIVLGDYMTDDNGKLSVGVTLPNDLQPGYHTIHLYGKSYSGEAIDLYQVIRFEPLIVAQDTNVTAGQPGAASIVDGPKGAGETVDYMTNLATNTQPNVGGGAESILGLETQAIHSPSITYHPSNNNNWFLYIIGGLLATSVLGVIMLVVIKRHNRARHTRES